MVSVIDSFEDGDLSEYGGDTSYFDIENGSQYSGWPSDGSKCLRMDDGGGGTTRAIVRNSPTVSTGEGPLKADLMTDRVQFAGGPGGRAGLLFGVQSVTGMGSINGYWVKHQLAALKLYRVDDGTATELAEDEISDSSIEEDTSPVATSVDTWASDGTIEVSSDFGGDSLSVSVTDSTYQSGYLGWTGYYNNDGEAVMDYLRGPAQAPTAPSNLQLSLQ